MFANFFQLSSLPANQMLGTYDIRLVILSYIVATFASYIALDITGRVRDIGNTKLVTSLWIFGGAFAMGAGIWSMHFIGMLAFTMPMMTITYDPFWTGLSMLVAVFASSFTFLILKNKITKLPRIIFGGIILGIAIASMHYVGMEAMKIVADIHYLPGLFLLSIIIAILASEAALYLALKSNQVVANMRFKLKFISAFIMGAAICGMHYTGMAAAVFTPLAAGAYKTTSSIDPTVLAISIAGVTFLILGIAVFVSTYKEALNQQLLTTARQAGMAEVAASVLHNVGNVLNSVNISAALVKEKLALSKLKELNNLSRLIHEHQHDLVNFMTHDPNGSQIPMYIQMLAQEWDKEKTAIAEEVEILIKNIEHIKNVIAMQQNLSRVTNLEQIISLDKTLDEALFITGIDANHPEIKIEKHYGSVKPFFVDKIKILQILVNLIHNAKDAVLESGKEHKNIKLTIHPSANGWIKVDVVDNGVGILPGNKTKIFSYGFTTKKAGHGFGLHTSALAAKEMGGFINASSEGQGKGSTFTLKLPYKLPS